jgi:hypothetical protein
MSFARPSADRRRGSSANHSSARARGNQDRRQSDNDSCQVRHKTKTLWRESFAGIGWTQRTESAIAYVLVSGFLRGSTDHPWRNQRVLHARPHRTFQKVLIEKPGPRSASYHLRGHGRARRIHEAINASTRLPRKRTDSRGRSRQSLQDAQVKPLHPSQMTNGNERSGSDLKRAK